MQVCVEFGLLGPLTVRHKGAVVSIAQGRQRHLLAALLLDANHLVTTAQLTHVLWGATPPTSVRAALHNQVRRLRDALCEVGRERIRTQPGGYFIHLEPGELDVMRLQDLLASAQTAAREGAWEQASGLAASAVLLWRGEPLADVDSEVLALRIPHLTEIYLQAAETRLEAEVRLGHHAEVVSELRRFASDHPLREHLHALVMLALYRCGRQGEALAAYQTARRILIGELGSEPGQELKQLHQRILSRDPELGVPGPTLVTESQIMITPRELPGAVGHFTGRVQELAMLTGLLDGAGYDGPGALMISAIGGTAGVGKTALAVHWAHQVAGRFPDGQLYANLHGFDPTGTPATPDKVIRTFLDALRVPAEQIPLGPAERAGLYRSLLAGRRMLILLDNVRDAEQVRPLLPGTSGCLVVVTSRSQLAGLAATHGALLVNLEMLSGDEAAELLARRVGPDRVTAEPKAASELAGLCGGLPLALTITAARAAARPGFRLTDMTAELRDEYSRLDALDAGEEAASIRAVFSWSYQSLTALAARLFRLLGLHPGPDISVLAAASLAGIDVSAARTLFGQLTDARLITEHVPGRYAFHDLLRAYAAEQARAVDTRTELQAAISRVLDHYLYGAVAAERLLNPQRDPINLGPPQPGTIRESFADLHQAMAWFEAERTVLLTSVTLAARMGFDTHVWQLAWALASFLDRRAHWHEWEAIQRTAVAAAQRLGAKSAQAHARRGLGHACVVLGSYQDAHDQFEQALRMYTELGDPIGQSRVHVDTSWSYGNQGRDQEALYHAEQALLLSRAAGHRAAEASALNSVGWHSAHLRDYQRALVCCQQALDLYRVLGDRHWQATIWDSLAYAHDHLGDHTQALTCYNSALSIYRELGAGYYQARTLARLADTHQAAGQPGSARDARRQALTILDDLGHPDAPGPRRASPTPSTTGFGD
jgi:DNA-binding SARP family transcriptional activator/tetratricopeptide (TPR) repeat protein